MKASKVYLYGDTETTGFGKGENIEHPSHLVGSTSSLVDEWNSPAVVAPNNFVFKSLSSFSFNPAFGCGHGCAFCYVPELQTKQRAQLNEKGVTDTSNQWGQYLFVRQWDEKKFRESLRTAENMPPESLKRDGHRAVMFSTTTDAYQVVHHPDPPRQRELQQALGSMVSRALELILECSTLNVRILTRSPLAEKDFNLYRRFGNRLLFGMSLPTLNDRLARVYEPQAPAPTQRLRTLRKAKEAGLNLFVAVAPTYPACDEADLRKTLGAVADLNPFTIFHEPINIRANNVERITAQAQTTGVLLNTAVFATRDDWRAYAIGQLMLVERIATELGILDRLHLWPDKELRSKTAILSIRKKAFLQSHPHATTHEKALAQQADLHAYARFESWIDGWHTRISEWPGSGTVEATPPAAGITP
jgi:DNA repair photolyase